MRTTVAGIEGRTILVTRSAEDSEAWAAELARRGARPVVFPCIGHEAIDDDVTRAALARALRDSDWLALTSARGAEAVAGLAASLLPLAIRVAAVGETTAAAARSRLGRADMVAPDGTARSLSEALAGACTQAGADLKVLVPAAEGGKRDLEEILGPLGVTVTRIAVYRTVPATAREPREELAALGIDTIFLASPSAVTGLLARAEVPASARIVTIGPSTSAAARRAGLRVAGEAAGRGLNAMIEATPPWAGAPAGPGETVEAGEAQATSAPGSGQQDGEGAANTYRDTP